MAHEFIRALRRAASAVSEQVDDLENVRKIRTRLFANVYAIVHDQHHRAAALVSRRR